MVGSSTGPWYSTTKALFRNWHRLNFALTRAKHGLILVGQQDVLKHSVKENEDPFANTMYHLVNDLLARGLVLHPKVGRSHRIADAPSSAQQSDSDKLNIEAGKKKRKAETIEEKFARFQQSHVRIKKEEDDAD